MNSESASIINSSDDEDFFEWESVSESLSEVCSDDDSAIKRCSKTKKQKLDQKEEASWDSIACELINSFIDDQKKKILQVKNIDLEINKLGQQVSLIELPDWALIPEIKRHNINKKQIDSLLIARFFLWQAVWTLGEYYRIRNSLPSLEFCKYDKSLNENTCISGHHVVATIELLNIPLNNADIENMLKFKSDKKTYNHWISSLDSFKLTFDQIGRFSKSENCSNLKLEKKRSDNVSKNLFISSRCNELFNIAIDWHTWCSIFETTELKVQANGYVW